jgi:hypothetical protein
LTLISSSVITSCMQICQHGQNTPSHPTKESCLQVLTYRPVSSHCPTVDTGYWEFFQCGDFELAFCCNFTSSTFQFQFFNKSLDGRMSMMTY